MSTPIRILFIEDCEDDTLLQVRMLNQAGYAVAFDRVDSFESLRKALARSWDLIISDYSMPHFNGSEALGFVRKLGIDVPFIFVSGTIGEETAVAALKQGAQDYLMKSNLQRLVSAVQRELHDADVRRQNRLLERQVGQLRRFEAIGRLAGGVAHDFNNMIGAIMGWSDLGLAESAPQSPSHDRFLKIRAQSERAATLTKQLLAFARKQVLQPQNIDLNHLVEEEINLLTKVIGERIAVRLELACDLSPAWADPAQIEQVLMNLCLNARDAMPNGGQLSVKTCNVRFNAEDSSKPEFMAAGIYVCLLVSDTGVGMNPETIEHIFEPFFSTKDLGKGTGLGLATVYGIVKQHQGFINVESFLDAGTTFTVYLPVGAGAPQTPKGMASALDLERGSETILLAEDNEGLREIEKEMLESLGYTVIATQDGEDAVETFSRFRDSVDLLLLDIVMPKLDGPAAYAKIAALRKDPPVIFTTGYAAETSLVAAKSLHNALILHKPCAFATLAHKTRQLLDESRSKPTPSDPADSSIRGA